MRAQAPRLRQCVSCRQFKPQADLIRVGKRARSPGRIDPDGRFGGRGAYVCSTSGCLSLALKRGAIARALRGPLAEETIQELQRRAG